MGAIFGGGPKAPPAEEPTKTRIDPNRDAELAEAARRKQAIFARRGRSFLRGDSGTTRGGVTFAGSGSNS